MVNVNLGMPHEDVIKRAIKGGYATSQAEVIRQALMDYGEKLSELEELILVHRAVEREMEKIKKGEVKTRSLKEVIKELEGA